MCLSKKIRQLSLLTTYLLIVSCQTPEELTEPMVIGQVSSSVGYPVVNRNNQKYILARKSTIYPSDIFDTDETSMVRMTLLDGTSITIGPHSHLMLQNFTPQTETVATLTKGVLLIRTAEKNQLALRTPLALVRLNAGELYAGFAANTLEVTLLADGNMTTSNDDGAVTINASGLGTTVIAGSAPQSPYAWSISRMQKALEGFAAVSQPSITR